MENVKFQLRPVDYNTPYEQQPDCKRHVIGAYANLARHNMTVTVNVIMQAIGMPLCDENKIENAFNGKHLNEIAKLDNIQKVNLQKRLYRHFPFLKRMKLEDEKKKSVQLDALLSIMGKFTRCMADIRNFYTHYMPYNSPAGEKKQLDLKKDMGQKLQYLFENSSKIFKEREKLDHAANEVLNSIRRREDRKYVYNHDYQAYMMSEDDGLSDVGILYFLCLFLEKKVAFELMEDVGFTKQCRFRGKDADQQMLLLKEMMCMNRIRMTKTKLDSEMTETSLALDMLNELRKCPKPLYEVLEKEAREEFKDDATVQWETENGREAVDVETENEEDGGESEEPQRSVPRSTFVRWDDRFPHLALSYIDMTGMFADIRFQLNLGKYRFAFYTHDSMHSVDGRERLRILQKELHGFGRIQEVAQTVREKWRKLYKETYEKDGLTQTKADTAGQEPYVTEQKPQYAIDMRSHSIGLRWEGWESTGTGSLYRDLAQKKMFIPGLPSKPSQPIEGRQTNLAERLLAPQCMLNLYELPGLLFYHYLLVKYGEDKSQAERTIKQYCEDLRRFFMDVAKGRLRPVGAALGDILQANYGLDLSDIPDKLRKYLSGKTTDNTIRLRKSAKRRLEERLERKCRALDDLRDKRKKIGTKQNKFDKMRATIKTGQLAALLMRDIADWLPQDSDARQRLTGQTYAALQADMTMMGQKITIGEGENQMGVMSLSTLESCFSRAGIVASHPFLCKAFKECFKKASVENLYEQYLLAEIEYINERLSEFNKAKTDEQWAALYRLIPFLHHERARWNRVNKTEIQQLAQRYLQRPVQLPNGIFARPIFSLLLKHATPNEELGIKGNAALLKALAKIQSTDAEAHQSSNVALLIRLYLKNVERDHSQPFYNTTAIDGVPSPYRRVYRVFKKLYGERIGRTNRTTSPAYTVEEIRARLNELNAQKTTDEALKRKLRKVNDNERTIRRYKTQDVLLFFMAREILKAKTTERDFASKFSLKYVMDEKILDLPIDFSWNVSFKAADGGNLITKTIEQKGMKMKDYGQFYKFASDHQRLASLLSRLPGVERFLRAEIENEFSYYDRNRSEVFRLIYIIESAAYELMPGLKDDANCDQPWFISKQGKYIRNSFSELLRIFVTGEDGILDDKEKVLLQTMRNAFGHNTYDVDMDAVFAGRKNKMKVPEVANGMKQRIAKGTTELKEKLHK